MSGKSWGDGMVKAAAFVEKVRIPLDAHWGYIYGTWGEIWTEAKQKRATRPMTIQYGSQWIGRMVTDCSGLLRWALKQLGEDILHHARYQYTDCCRKGGQLINGARADGQPIKPGTAVFLKGSKDKIHHVGVYVGDGICIEAKGTITGVTTSRLDHWDHWGELKVVDYSEEKGDTWMMLKKGAKGAAVKNLQTMLNQWAKEFVIEDYFLPLTEDGVFGQKTEDAVKLLQQTYSLTADGIAGPDTLDLLAALLAAPSEDPQPETKPLTAPELPEDADEIPEMFQDDPDEPEEDVGEAQAHPPDKAATLEDIMGVLKEICAILGNIEREIAG